MQSILQHFFKKKNLEAVPIDVLRQLVQQYPFFAPGHFWLAKKLYNDNDPAYKEQLRSAGIYFYNPLWLHFQFPSEPRQSGTGVQPETHRMAMNGDDDVPYTHDLVEDVVLHQEAVYDTVEPTTVETPAFTDPSGPGSSVSNPAPETPAASDQRQRENGLNEKEEALPLQAYHTVDYFASQGIRLSQELTPDDKLGKQLKSFTEWLKTMRRLPQTPIEDILEVSPPDAVVEQFAAHSLEENEVVTEAMAEVLLKQGKKDRARDVYQKLSLLNPHKSAYFAAKIDVLKPH